MPTAAPKPCSQCGVLVHDGSTRCSRHKPVQWVKRPEVQRITGRRLQVMRLELFAREPMCRICAQAGRFKLATIRDHIVPLTEGGTEDEANIQPICGDCDTVKSKAERLRARGLGPRPAPLALPSPRPAAQAAYPHPGAGHTLEVEQLETDRLGKFSRAQVSKIFLSEG